MNNRDRNHAHTAKAAAAAVFLSLAFGAASALANTGMKPGTTMTCMALECASPGGRHHALRESGDGYGSMPSTFEGLRAAYLSHGISPVKLDKLAAGFIQAVAQIEAAPEGRAQRLVTEAVRAAALHDVDTMTVIAVMAAESQFGAMDPEADLTEGVPSAEGSRSAMAAQLVASRLRTVSMPLPAAMPRAGDLARLHEDSLARYFETYGKMTSASARAVAGDVLVHAGQLAAIWRAVEKALVPQHEAVLQSEPAAMEAFRLKQAAQGLISEASAARQQAAARPVTHVDLTNRMTRQALTQQGQGK